MTTEPAGRDALTEVVSYYERRLADHGPTPAGVDWNSVSAQTTRFEQLTSCITDGQSVLDLGCGYGALLDYLESKGWTGDYVGSDLSAEMIRTAISEHPGRGRFVTSIPTGESFDVVVASGLFNVKLDAELDVWRDYVDSTILTMFDRCRVAIGFNLLTSYSDPNRRSPTLYYGPPGRYLHFCAVNCSRKITLLHDYGLYEFTMIVRR